MTNRNEPAFPEVNHDNPQFSYPTYGLTKREYFAAMAMQGIVADPNGYIMAADIAKGAVEIADALIEQLNK